MRIVAGEFRGKAIEAPAGEGTRPTADRVREALFSSLFSLRGGFEGAAVLDAFAGSGALGLEALSRGAARAVFFERDSQAAKVLRRNVESCKLDASRAHVLQRDVLASPPGAADGPFDVVFLDPPYAFDAADIARFVADLAQGGMLAPDAVVVYEHALARAGEAQAALEGAGLDARKSKKYGKTGVTCARWNGGAQ